jgi:gliding motility-associated-like protein
MALFIPSKSQHYLKGQVFYGASVQNVTQIFFDKLGNRYQVVAFSDTLYFDSAGIKISIPNLFGQPSIAILKYDSNDTYQFHIKTNLSPSNPIDIKFDANHYPYLLCQFPQADSLLLYHANGLLFKNVKPNYRKLSGDLRFTLATAICKLNPNGQFQWCNSIFRESLSTDRTSNRSAFLFTTVNNSEIIKVCFVNTRVNENLNDTIGLQNSVNVKSLIAINSRHLFINYDLNGGLISHAEPFKGRLQYDQRDSINFFYRYLKEVKLLSDGENTYAYLNLFVSKSDSINTVSKVPLFYGNNYLLLKLNRFDSIIWVKPLYVEKLNKFYSAYLTVDFDLDKERQKLLFLLNFSTNEYTALFKPSLNTLSTNGSFLFQMDLNGQMIKEDSFGLLTNFYSIALNPYHQNYCFIGQINASNPRFSSNIPNELSNKLFLGLVSMNDSGNVDAPIAPLISNISQLSTSIYFNTINAPSDFVTPSGVGYVFGYFRDSIRLACNQIKSLLSDTNQFGTNYGDGFVVYHRFSKLLNINDCFSFLSPSKKYVWNSSGIYSDTLISSLGCDSIISINLNLKGNFIELDTQVLTHYISPSGRFNIDISGIYYDTLVNSSGCDSIYRIKLKVLNSKSIIDTFNCFPIQLFSKNEWLTSSGVYYDTLQNAVGGDSLITIRFSLGRFEQRIDTTNCNDIMSPLGRWLTQSGMYYDTLRSAQHCDSIIILDFKRLNSFSNFSLNVCDSVLAPSGSFYISQTGIYYDTLVNANGCDSIVRIDALKTNDSFSLTKSNDIDCDFDFSELSVNGTNISSVTWAPAQYINDTNALSPKVFPQVSTTYYAKVINSFGCVQVDSISIEVRLEDSLGIFPNVFTPNGDGVNDCISLKDYVAFEEVEFSVFNRWGNLVYTTASPNACWGGESNSGNRLSEGVYFFVLTGKSVCGASINTYGSITMMD